MTSDRQTDRPTDLALARKRDDSDPGLVIRDGEVRQQLLDELDLVEEVLGADGGRGVDEEHQLHSLARCLTKGREGSCDECGWRREEEEKGVGTGCDGRENGRSNRGG